MVFHAFGPCTVQYRLLASESYNEYGTEKLNTETAANRSYVCTVHM